MIGKIIGFLFIIGYLLVIALFLFGIPLFFIIYSLKIVKDKEKGVLKRCLPK